MASTYSNLKIQLMGTGENNGTWGNVTNTNLGTAIEEAIAGSADVTFSNADVTLTLTDTNTSQTARNMRLRLTGTISTVRYLTVPAIEKMYIITNDLNYGVYVRNPTGGFAFVAAGKTTVVYSTGTDVFIAIDYIGSLDLGIPLATTEGGTGTNSTTYCNLQANVTGTLPNDKTTASSSNGSSTIVARDVNGSFTANVITANGSALTALNATNISSGTISNARTTASSSNGASTIIARNASGSFTANTMTGTATQVQVNVLGGGGGSYVLMVGSAGAGIGQTPYTYSTLTYNTYGNLLETNINGNATTANAAVSVSGSTSNGYGTRTVSTSAPTGGNNGDIWYQY